MEFDALTEAEFEQYEKLLQLEAAYNNLRDFIALTMPKYQFNWHHEVLINRLQKLTEEKDKRIMVFMPPRHGKSEIVSRRFPAWLLGRDPNHQIISCSYAQALATNFNRDVQRIMESEVYHEIFPDTLIPNTPFSKSHPDNGKYKRQSFFFEILDYIGSCLGVGVGGPITGLGCNTAIVDDPVKNSDEADSETLREAIWEWYVTTLYTRLEGGANLIVCQTRWHKQDLSGKLLEEMELGGEKWEIINFPAIKTDEKNEEDPRKIGEALWPEKYSVGRLEVIKRQSARSWSALYQQSPIIEGGNYIKEDWIQYYSELPFSPTNYRECYLVSSWDLGFKDSGKSFTVGVVLAKHKNNFYMLDIHRSKADIIGMQNAIRRFSEKYPQCKVHLIEDKANGPAIIQLMKREILGIIPVTPVAKKDERLFSIVPIFEAGHFYMPSNAPWAKMVVEELISFPNSDTDDICDAISQGLNRFQQMKGLAHLRAITKW